MSTLNSKSKSIVFLLFSTHTLHLLSALFFSSYKWKTSFPSELVIHSHFGFWQWTFFSDTAPVITKILSAKPWSKLLFNSAIVLDMWSQWHQSECPSQSLPKGHTRVRAKPKNLAAAELGFRVYLPFPQATSMFWGFFPLCWYLCSNRMSIKDHKLNVIFQEGIEHKISEHIAPQL